MEPLLGGDFFLHNKTENNNVVENVRTYQQCAVMLYRSSLSPTMEL